ncbi:MAG: transporter substrate-binding domain-containing protein [Alphaproteobacteria bacterium]
MRLSNVLRSAAVAAVALMAAVPAVQADVLDDIRAAKKVRIAIDFGVPPYGMTDDKMQPAGSDVDTARALAKDWGVALEIVPTTGASRIPSLQTGKADLVISTLSITAERAKVIDFSVGYASLRTVLAGTKGVAAKSVADLKGKTIGTTRGTTHDTWLANNAKESKIIRYEDDATTAQAFVSGQVDLFTTAELLLAPIAAKNPGRQLELKFPLEIFTLAVGVKKGEAKLLAEVNAWVRANLKNGTLNAIYKKHHGNDLPQEIIAAGS